MSSYDLNSHHKIRYFYETEDRNQLLKDVRRFLQKVDGVEVINFNHRDLWDHGERRNVILWTAHVVYLGGIDA